MVRGSSTLVIKIIILFLAKSKRPSAQIVITENLESDDENDVSQQRSDDEEFRNDTIDQIFSPFIFSL